MAIVALGAGVAALTIPGSWLTVSAGSQVQPERVAMRTASNNADEIVAPGVIVAQKPVVDIPEEVSLLIVGAVLVGLAGVLRRQRVEETPHRGSRRAHISGVSTPRRASRVESARRAS
jgi:hypothetical protein